MAQALHLVRHPHAPSGIRARHDRGEVLRRERRPKGLGGRQSGVIEYICDAERDADHLSAVIPALAIAGANAYVLWNEHWEHWAHSTPLEECQEYSYQNIRTKNFFFGDGDKTML